MGRTLAKYRRMRSRRGLPPSIRVVHHADAVDFDGSIDSQHILEQLLDIPFLRIQEIEIGLEGPERLVRREVRDSAAGGAVALELRLQFVQRGEMDFVAETTEEGDGEGQAVDVFVETQDVGFDGGEGAADGGAEADVRHAVPGLAKHLNFNHIHSSSGHEFERFV